MRGRSHLGFTLIDTAAVVAVLAVAGLLGGVATQPSALRAARDSARQMKDATQLRAILQAMIIWAQNNGDVYPLPSAIDTANVTVKEQGPEKDTTANIYSMMVFTGFISTEVCVSPVEKNPAVTVKHGYEFDRPSGTVDPTKAVWDPKFSAALGPEKGNVSYANLQPFGNRLKRWRNTGSAAEVVLATRGPEIASVAKNEDTTVTPKLAKADSYALRLFGDGKSWSGHAAFNDNRVEFATDKMAGGRPMGRNEPTYKAKDGKAWPDIWCFNEPDDAAGVNNYLGLFVKAGKTEADWKAAWD